MTSSLVGKKSLIHGYKHDGSAHRSWDSGLVLEETADYFVVFNNKTLVTESDGRRWYTREPAICFFSKHDWYNVICMLRKNGVYYYCNIASPTLYDGEALKYIDYDLDLKVFPDNTYKILDRNEFQTHAHQMKYSKRLIYICNKQLQLLIKKVKKRQDPFNKSFLDKWYAKYEELEKRNGSNN